MSEPKRPTRRAKAKSLLSKMPWGIAAILRLGIPEREELLRGFTPREWEVLIYDWRIWARPDQLPPDGDWVYWLILAGRGAGKTRAGAEAVREWIKNFPIVNLIGPTADDVRDVMVMGDSGLLARCPNNERPRYLKASAKLKWPNGAISLLFSAEEPDRLRGKQHMKLWCDELAAWRRPDAFDQALLGLRLGGKPQAVITTTPRPIKTVRQLIEDKDAIVTRGSTFDNSNHLARAFLERITARYAGRQIGRQELFAELIEETPGALWTRELIERHRIAGGAAPGRVCRDRRRRRSAGDFRPSRRRMRHCRRGQSGQWRNLCAGGSDQPGRHARRLGGAGGGRLPAL